MKTDKDLLQRVLDTQVQEMYRSQLLFDATAAEPKKLYKGYMVDRNTFIPIGDTVDKLPSGRYGFHYTMNGVYPYLKAVSLEDVIELPNPIYKRVLDDLTSFWSRSDDYKKHGFIPRRGIMVYGPPGNGKSCLLQLVSDKLIKEHDGLIFDVYSNSDLGGFMGVMAAIRQVESERKVVCMLEDCDNLMYGSKVSSELLNLLDGNSRINDITYIATTNYFDSLPDNIKNRPSRFNRKYLIPAPSAKEREVFLSTKFPELTADMVKAIVKHSDGYTIDTLKELVISTQVLGMTMDEAVGEIEGQFSRQGDRKSLRDGEGVKVVVNKEEDVEEKGKEVLKKESGKMQEEVEEAVDSGSMFDKVENIKNMTVTRKK